ncbi:hypothetical protein H310_12688 [Aphanomyces invadans]|uniref:Uncharacterized protein n=1 Tax=Aphanomyces invadans TaxID=157072 RepID=A0A024TI34_9STRA|nr:hypothetical protein H310_12688 [Aphanomyces invadans]ETV93251.1 hypothetical protein H310_12688 [Aphanomyces invadans]|eukprot:XP_008878086.1 hypothetical protein H310_12688 [Aphanomyces invadans]
MLFGWLRNLPWKRGSTGATAAVRRLNAMPTAPQHRQVPPRHVPIATSHATRDFFDSMSANELRHMLHRLEDNWRMYQQKMPRLSTTLAVDLDSMSFVANDPSWARDSVALEEHMAASEWV